MAKEPLACIAKAHNTTQAVVILSWLVQNDAFLSPPHSDQKLDEYAQALNIKLSTYHFRTSWPD